MRCPECNGLGRVAYDKHDDGEDIVEDCINCEGTGTV